MSTTTATGLTVPNQDGTDHHREWEHAAALASSVGKRLPRIGSYGPTFAAQNHASGSTWNLTNLLNTTARGYTGETIIARFSVQAETLTANIVQTIGLATLSPIGCVVTAEDENTQWRVSGSERQKFMLVREVVLAVTAAAGAQVAMSAQLQVGTGLTQVRFANPRCTTIRGLAESVL